MTSEPPSSMFLPNEDDSTLFCKPTLRVTTVRTFLYGDLEEELLAFTDHQGAYLVPRYEILEILKAVSPFYDLFSDEQIKEINCRDRPSVPPRLPVRDRPAQIMSGYVYVMQAGPYYKIGRSRHPDRRLTQLQTQPPFDIELIHTIKTDDMYQLEAHLHGIFEADRVKGEWFELDEADVIWIRSLP